MGNNCCRNTKVQRKNVALLIVGLDNAGKTVTARSLAGEAISSPIPTIGFSVINLKYLQYNVRIFDLGGRPDIRGIWHKYFVDVHGVIFVVDSCDIERFHEVQTSLEEILSNAKIAGKPLLILANKQDKERSLDEIDIIECLHIESLVNKHKCPTLVQSCSASETNYNKLDQGIKIGYEWLMNYISKNFEQLNIRVQMDVIEQELEDKEEMIAKLKRIRDEREATMHISDPDAIQTYSEYVSKLNGDAVRGQQALQVYSGPEDNLTSDTSDSSLTFPTIYHLHNYSLERERPKSAVQLVKHQLQMTNELRRSSSVKRRRNKTAPVNLFAGKEFVPSLEIETNQGAISNKPQRNLRSADDRIYTISNAIGPGGDYYLSNFAREIFQIEEKFQVQKLPPLKVGHKANSNQQLDKNGMCVVDVE